MLNSVNISAYLSLSMTKLCVTYLCSSHCYDLTLSCSSPLLAITLLAQPLGIAEFTFLVPTYQNWTLHHYKVEWPASFIRI